MLGQYKNCDHGYAVTLPTGVAGHGTLPPFPNHGILISAADPGTIDEVTWKSSRVIGIYDSNDAEQLGPRAYLEAYPPKNGELVKAQKLGFKKLAAVNAQFRIDDGHGTVENDLVLYRRGSGELSPIFYVITLKTSAEHYEQDYSLYEKIRDGFEILPPPRGECSND